MFLSGVCAEIYISNIKFENEKICCDFSLAIFFKIFIYTYIRIFFLKFSKLILTSQWIGVYRPYNYIRNVCVCVCVIAWKICLLARKHLFKCHHQVDIIFKFCTITNISWWQPFKNIFQFRWLNVPNIFIYYFLEVLQLYWNPIIF